MSSPIRIDLISDTSTRPTAAMREAMAQAEVGDEQLGEDPSVNLLCERVAELLGKEAAIYLPSGIMSNLIAILVHCRPGDEIIAAGNSHIISSEGAGPSAIAGAMITTIDTADGRFTLEQFENRIRPRRARVPRTRLLSVEQTSNRGGGTIWPATTLESLAAKAAQHDMAVHMDGARLLNASVASNSKPTAFTAHCDSTWLDLSKGLGCPVGSVLAGSRDFIDEAWIWKHRLGGAMRQAGVIAAAGLYALDHHVDRLVEDHSHAQRLADSIRGLDGISIVGDRVETNLIFIDVSGTGHTAPDIAKQLLDDHGVRVGAPSSTTLRAVTHLDVNTAQIDEAISAFRSVIANGATPD